MNEALICPASCDIELANFRGGRHFPNYAAAIQSRRLLARQNVGPDAANALISRDGRAWTGKVQQVDHASPCIQ